jgi:signal transduction histidine kinase
MSACAHVTAPRANGIVKPRKTLHLSWCRMPSNELFQPRLVRGDRVDDGPNVLIVDDVDANLIALEAVLSSLRCRLVYARSGSEALAHLLREDFALILMDVQMPDMDGYETARLVRARRKSEHIPIIFLTAHDYDSVGIKRAYELGAVDFLPKPLDIDVLRAKAQAFIALHERTLEVAELRAERAMLEERARQESEALRRDMERLADSDRRKTELLATLAHALRSPLTPVRTSIDEVRRTSPETNVTTALDLAERQLRHAERIIDDLLDVTRISSGELELQMDCVDLAVIIERAAAEVLAALESRGHTLVLDPPAEPIAIDADVTQMVRVLTNLLVNAVRYTPPRGTITIAWRREYGHAFVRVVDTGIGIRRARLDTLFDMVVPQHDGTGRTLGLGLALCKHLVELHRGTISATSAGEGQGSTFEIRLLASEFPLVAARNRLVSSRQRALARPRIMRVLVVEDDDDARRQSCALLAGRGHEVITAPDAKVALGLLAEHRPDVALVAVDLPRIDGCELIHLAQRIDPPLPTRFIAMAATDPEIARAREAGFATHVTKPIVSSSIVLAIESE